MLKIFKPTAVVCSRHPREDGSRGYDVYLRHPCKNTLKAHEAYTKAKGFKEAFGATKEEGLKNFAYENANKLLNMVSRPYEEIPMPY